MTLAPVRAASTITEQLMERISKMDDDTAYQFTYTLMSDVLEEAVERNLPMLQQRLDQVVAKRLGDLKKAVANTVSKSNADQALAYARAIREMETLINKAGDPQWRESDFRRDGGGRFTFKPKVGGNKPIDSRTAEAMGIPKVKDERYKRLPKEAQARYQQEYSQLAQFLSMVNESTGGQGNNEVLIHWKDKGGNHFVERNNGTPPTDRMLDPDYTLDRVVAKPTTLTLGGAAFGLSGGMVFPGPVNGFERQFGTFANDFTRSDDSDRYNSNAQTYRRLAAGSALLGSMSTPGSAAASAAKLGEFMGSMGPEAEKVIGPTARKTAYRYRGTEKKPDEDLVGKYGRAIGQAKSRTSAETNARRPLSTVQQAAQRHMNERRDPTMDERLAGVSVIANHLRHSGNFPKPGLYGLQLASGNTPPSEGVMLNDKGQIVAQAVGYGDDHYLPFNLKNLKALKGGEYVRTRSVGGPTSEDIYTGLMSGARRVTVVSRSGAFTVTFEDDFRGGRRHNDKARRMTRRYEQILDAVQSEQINRGDIDVDVKGMIREDVENQAEAAGMDRMWVLGEIKRREKEYRDNPDVITREDDAIIDRNYAEEFAAETDPRKRRVLKQQAIGERLLRKETKFKLNGAGYADALSALEEQFPYYIKVNSTSKHEEEVFQAARDKGYVEPGRNRPREAKAGWYGTDPSRSGKFSAADADYQGARGRAASMAAASQPVAPKQGETKEGEKTEAKTTEMTPAQQKSQNYRRYDATNALAAHLMENYNLPEADQNFLKTPAALNAVGAQDKMLDILNRINKTGVEEEEQGQDFAYPDKKLVEEYKAAFNEAPRTEYKRGDTVWKEVPDRPAGFGPNMTDEQKTMALQQLQAPTLTDTTKTLAGMSEEELKREHTVWNRLREHYMGSDTQPTPDERTAMGIADRSQAANYARSVATADIHLDKINSVRWLKRNMSEADQSTGAAQYTIPPKTAREIGTGDNESPMNAVQMRLDGLQGSLASQVQLMRETGNEAKAERLENMLADMSSRVKEDEFETTEAFDAAMAEHRDLVSEAYLYGRKELTEPKTKEYSTPTGTLRMVNPNKQEMVDAADALKAAARKIDGGPGSEKSKGLEATQRKKAEAMRAYGDQLESIAEYDDDVERAVERGGFDHDMINTAYKMLGDDRKFGL